MDMFQAVQDTLDLCSVHDSSTSIDIVDRTVLLLQICSNLLDDAVRMFPRGSTANTLGHELCVLISQLLVHWETKLLQLENSSLPGRSKVIINVEMVSEAY